MNGLSLWRRMNKTRRITKKQEEELLMQPLTAEELIFIKSLIIHQNKFPQLSKKQWEIFKKIYDQRVN